MDSLQTDDFIEIDFNNGIIKKVKDMQVNKSSFDKIAIDLNDEVWCDKSEVGNKAWNFSSLIFLTISSLLPVSTFTKLSNKPAHEESSPSSPS